MKILPKWHFRISNKPEVSRHQSDVGLVGARYGMFTGILLLCCSDAVTRHYHGAQELEVI